MLPGSLISKLIKLGISDDQSIEISSRLKITNKFNLLCISYSVPYIFFALITEFYGPAIIFFSGLWIYVLSLYFNSIKRYDLAKYLILFATNISVFFLSIYYGFESGFHLYYFTTPLIVFSIYNFSEKFKVLIGISLYLISLFALELSDMKWLITNEQLPARMASGLYTINTFLAMSFCLLMVTHFSSFNKKINFVLALKNEELEKKRFLLENVLTERRNAEKELQSLLKDKEILLSEIHHRVKNNLAIVSGMLDLEVLFSDDEKIRSILNDSRSRIKSMSLIHESLYNYDNSSRIEFGRYIKILAEKIQLTYLLPFSVKIIYELDEVYLTVEKAIPCGLLANELLTNAFKHAFIGRSDGEITIILKQNDGICTVSINDNGVGMNVSSNMASKEMGMTLIEAFIKQLNGTREFVRDNGTKLTFSFEL